MEVLIEEIIWSEPIDIFEGTINFSIEGVKYSASSFGYDYKVGSKLEVEFDHISDETTWEERFNNNFEKKKCLIKTGNWSYDGYGQIISINPVVANFGQIELELGDWTNDKRVIGEYIFWKILRLDICPKGKELDI